MEKGKKIFANYLLSVLNTVIALVIPIINFPYVSRVLGSNNLGIVNFAQSYGYYFMHIANFGISSYAVREVSKVRENPSLLKKKVNEIYNINFFFSVISWIMFMTGVIVVPKFRENAIVFFIYSVVILTNFLALEWLLQSFDDYFFVTIRNFVLRVAALLSVFIFVKKREDYVIYMMITAVSEMGIRFSTLGYSKKRYVDLKLRVKYLNFKEHFNAMFTLFSFRIVNGISAQLDKLMIGFMLTYSDVGVYSAGVKFALLVIPVIETVGIVMFPTMNIQANECKEKYLKSLQFNYKAILLMGIPMATGIFLIAPGIISIFVGDGYDGAVEILRIMSIVILLCPIGDMLGSKILLIYNKNKELLICSTIVAVSNVVLNAIFIPLAGINGAVTASVLSYVVAILSRYYFARKLIKVRLLNVALIKYVLFVIPFAVIYYVAKDIINRGAMEIIIYCFLSAALYSFFVLVSKDEIGAILISKLKTKRNSNENK